MLVAVVELAYRPELWYATDKEYLFLSLPLAAFNGFLHYRLRRDRAVTWRWLLFLSAVDIALITAVVIIGGDFHLFSYVAYYPALALFAVVFPHLWFSLAWATMAGAIYAVNGGGKVGQAEGHGGKHLLPEPVAGEGPGLAHQGADDVAVIDVGLPFTAHPLHAFHQVALVVHFQTLGVQAYLHLLPDEPGRGRCRSVRLPGWCSTCAPGPGS